MPRSEEQDSRFDPYNGDDLIAVQNAQRTVKKPQPVPVSGTIPAKKTDA